MTRLRPSYSPMPSHKYQSPKSAFCGADGRYYHLDDICKQIRRYHPGVQGLHVRDQLHTIGVLDQFEGGIVLMQLPYSFC